jgi:hypothetical protein
VNTTDEELRREWAPGWHLDLEYDIPRIVFSKHDGIGTSVCYIYEYKDIAEHVRTCNLTNLEQLEARSFYREHCIKLLKRRIEDRISLANNTVVHQFITERGTINTHKDKRR